MTALVLGEAQRLRALRACQRPVRRGGVGERRDLLDVQRGLQVARVGARRLEELAHAADHRVPEKPANASGTGSWPACSLSAAMCSASLAASCITSTRRSGSSRRGSA